MDVLVQCQTECKQRGLFRCEPSARTRAHCESNSTDGYKTRVTTPPPHSYLPPSAAMGTGPAPPRPSFILLCRSVLFISAIVAAQRCDATSASPPPAPSAEADWTGPPQSQQTHLHAQHPQHAHPEPGRHRASPPAHRHRKTAPRKRGKDKRGGWHTQALEAAVRWTPGEEGLGTWVRIT